MEGSEKDFYTCSMCGKIYTRYDSLRKHTRANHEQSERYTCDHCGKSYSHFYKLEEHILGHLGDERLKCKICRKVFSSVNRVKTHLNSVHSLSVMEETNGDGYTCRHCGKIFGGYLSFRRHTRARHEQNERYTCDHCGKSFAFFLTLKEHILGHMGDERVKCKICGKMLSSKRRIKAHSIRVHSLTTEDFYRPRAHVKCEHCGKVVRSDSIEEHRRIHTGESFECDVCHRRFSRPSHLRNHQKIHFPGNVEKPVVSKHLLSCDQCPKMYRSKKGLKRHKELTHISGKKHMCGVCREVFSSLDELTNHKETHPKPFQCNQCEKSFSFRCRLDVHVKEHTKYSCEECQAFFSNFRKLRKHQKTHGEIKPFQCKICGKTIYGVTELKDHENSHNGTEPCKDCGKHFKSIGGLLRHKNSLMDGKKSTCKKKRPKIESNRKLLLDEKDHRQGEDDVDVDGASQSEVKTDTLTAVVPKIEQVESNQGADDSKLTLDPMVGSTEHLLLKTVDRILAECRIKLESGYLNTVKTENLETGHS